VGGYFFPSPLGSRLRAPDAISPLPLVGRETPEGVSAVGWAKARSAEPTISSHGRHYVSRWARFALPTLRGLHFRDHTSLRMISSKKLPALFGIMRYEKISLNLFFTIVAFFST
jgi:hypothetical protein